MGAVVACATCGTGLRENARFCDSCGSAIEASPRVAEYKQVTVLFADVVHSMDIAKAVGAERLREIMAGLVDRAAAAVVGRYGGTLDKFTGDGIMAVFGAPLALEDHAVRACRAALDIHSGIRDLAEEVGNRDGLELQVRVGLNSGQVIAGAVGSGGANTAIGEQVGLAQRMESVAPPGGVMLSASTARLVEAVASLGDPELVQIKGAEQPVVARRLIGVSEPDRAGSAAVSALVGRRWEIAAVEGLLQRAIEGHGAVVTVVGSPGIGKSRLVREVSTLAAAEGVEVFSTYCESHTTQVPFHAVARLLRAASGVEHLDPEQARRRVRGLDSDADPEDVLLFEDLLGIRDPEIELPNIDPDARRRRLTALVNTATLAREAPAVYVIEDAHWIDEVSESMLADFFAVIPQAPSLVLLTYRPEYEGALTRVHGAQTIALAPLSNSETAALISELLGRDPSLGGLAALTVERSAGNPFFAEEIVRDLAERGVLRGGPGAYVSTANVAEVSMPATVQATIAARIDRLDPAAKRTLSAAAVIGSRFSRDLLETLGVDPVLGDLLEAQFLDQITFTRQPEYVFRHPLIRTVAYESQLKSDRADLHRKLAIAIESRDPTSADENAALIAEHLEAAGDLRSAYAWHMRAASWSTNRDIKAARVSWERACRVADALPADEPNRTAIRITPRSALCNSTWRAGLSVSDTPFAELREMCASTGDDMSLAIGMYGQVAGLALEHCHREASELASEQFRLIEASSNPQRGFAVLHSAALAKLFAGEVVAALEIAEWSVDVIGDDPIKGKKGGFGSPLAVSLFYRGMARCCLGQRGWRDDMRCGLEMQRSVGPREPVFSTLIGINYIYGLLHGTLLADDVAVRETAEAERISAESGDDVGLEFVRIAQGLVLSRHGEASERRKALEVLCCARDAQLRQHLTTCATMADIRIVELTAEVGHIDEAVDSGRPMVDLLFECGERFILGAAAAACVQALLSRGSDSDLQEAAAAIDRLAAVPTDAGFVMFEVPLLRLRALLAHAHGDEHGYRDYRDRYRKMATELGFEGHMQWAQEMP